MTHEAAGQGMHAILTKATGIRAGWDNAERAVLAVLACTTTVEISKP